MPAIKGLRRSDGPPLESVHVRLEDSAMAKLRAAAKAEGIAYATFARAPLMRGLSLEIEARRKRRAREAWQEGAMK